MKIPAFDCLRCQGTGIPLDNDASTCGCLREASDPGRASVPEGHQELHKLVATLRGIVEGFESEALNGVICTPPCSEYGGTGWTDKPNRTWCQRCRVRWATLRALPKLFDAALGSPRTPADICATCAARVER